MSPKTLKHDVNCSRLQTDQWEHGADQRHPIRAAREEGGGTQAGPAPGGQPYHEGAGEDTRAHARTHTEYWLRVCRWVVKRVEEGKILTLNYQKKVPSLYSPLLPSFAIKKCCISHVWLTGKSDSQSQSGKRCPDWSWPSWERSKIKIVSFRGGAQSASAFDPLVADG